VVTTVSAMTFRQRLGEMLGHVQYGGDSVIVTKAGTEVAALVDPQLFANIQAMRAKFDQLCAEIAEAAPPLPDDEGEALVAQLIAEERRGSR